jgi:hypothetical protein
MFSYLSREGEIMGDYTKTGKFRVFTERSNYPDDYKVRSITEQITKLQKTFPHLGFANKALVDRIECDEELISVNADENGFFAIPHWTKIAPSYGEAVEIMLSLLKKDMVEKDRYKRPFLYGLRTFLSHFSLDKRKFLYDFTQGKHDNRFLRETKSKKCMMENFLALQEADIIIIQAQFGNQYQKCSPASAQQVIKRNEFLLGIYEILVMLFTHPERLQAECDLQINVSGDEYSPDSDADQFVYVFYLWYYDYGKSLHLNYKKVHSNDLNSGSPSGFISKAYYDTFKGK